jgi:hypothetical protein
MASPGRRQVRLSRRRAGKAAGGAAFQIILFLVRGIAFAYPTTTVYLHRAGNELSEQGPLQRVVEHEEQNS